MKFATNLRTLRTRENLSQMQVAVKAGVGLSSVNKVDAAATLEELEPMRLEIFIRLARALGTSVAKLVPSLTEER